MGAVKERVIKIEKLSKQVTYFNGKLKQGIVNSRIVSGRRDKNVKSERSSGCSSPASKGSSDFSRQQAEGTNI